jgi:hypothetical protein
VKNVTAIIRPRELLLASEAVKNVTKIKRQ